MQRLRRFVDVQQIKRGGYTIQPPLFIIIKFSFNKEGEMTLHTCRNCGHTGDNLVGNYYWIGGQGDVLIYECRNCLAARWIASQKACEALKIAMERGER